MAELIGEAGPEIFEEFVPEVRPIEQIVRGAFAAEGFIEGNAKGEWDVVQGVKDITGDSPQTHLADSVRAVANEIRAQMDAYSEFMTKMSEHGHEYPSEYPDESNAGMVYNNPHPQHKKNCIIL